MSNARSYTQSEEYLDWERRNDPDNGAALSVSISPYQVIALASAGDERRKRLAMVAAAERDMARQEREKVRRCGQFLLGVLAVFAAIGFLVWAVVQHG